MTCVVAINDGKKVFMAHESAATSIEGDRRLITTNKIIKNDKYLIGFAGSIRVGQLLAPHYFKPPLNILNFPDALINHLEKKKSLEYSETQTAIFSCNMIIAFKNKLYEILADFQLNEPSVEYVSIGAGAPYALGSLSTTTELNINPIDRLQMALKSACLFSSDCKEPFHYFTT